MKKLMFVATMSLLLLVGSGVAMADAIPPQITLSSGTSGSIMAGLISNVMSLSFIGTVHGNALLDPVGDYGQYWLTLSGHPTMTSQGGGNYDINMNNAVLTLTVKLGPKGNGSLGQFVGTVNLDNITGGNTKTPQFVGTFDCQVSTGDFFAYYPMGKQGAIDFTVNDPPNPILKSVLFKGYLSSGEVVSPTPEPATLALVGTGVIGLAGLIRRKRA